jgi:glucose-6-phosphate isomerase
VPEQLSARYPTDLPAWKALKDHYRDDMKSRKMSDLFARDRERFAHFTVRSGDILLDYSKNFLSAKTKKLLVRLARDAQVEKKRDAMFAGEHINATEDRAVLHVALRSKISDQVALEEPGVSDVWRTLDQMGQFVNAVHDGGIRGSTGRRLTDIVNIGIGGSDLGIVMAGKALRQCWHGGTRLHCVSNIDGTQLSDLMSELDPQNTLFVVCSKTFTTLETLTNANAARAWIADSLGVAAVAHHFAAASTNHHAMDEFGINPKYRFGLWDWVGGRFSIWSAVGLSLALVIGMEDFQRFLSGARRMDQHFRIAPAGENMPILMALIAVWYNNFFDADSQAVLPYDNRLDRFPAFLQQMQMESNGKGVRSDGKPVKTKTGMVVWGEAGSNAQHSFNQLLHQGTRFVPVDFIVPAWTSGSSQRQQDLAIANCLAQSEALMDGYSVEQAMHDLADAGYSETDAKRLASHKVHPGNRPSNTILFPELTPGTLGQLVALYEHKVFVEGVIWGINSFDQWGVELGKRLATRLADVVSDDSPYPGENESTIGLLAAIKRLSRQSK